MVENRKTTGGGVREKNPGKMGAVWVSEYTGSGEDLKEKVVHGMQVGNPPFPWS